jgi:hypothetical protein
MHKLKEQKEDAKEIKKRMQQFEQDLSEAKIKRKKLEERKKVAPLASYLSSS